MTGSIGKMNSTFDAVSVEQMAQRREKRAMEQFEMLSKGNEKRCVVCIGMNIAGPEKRSGLIDAAFVDAVRCFVEKTGIAQECCYGEKASVELRFINESTGIEALFAIDEDAKKLKRICTGIEEEHCAGRLFDMDVIEKSGKKLVRDEPRRCLICSKNASICARSRAHSLEKLQMCTQELLVRHFSTAFAVAARDALISEVNITPKPGLVDRFNSGANPDMNIGMFHRSAESLYPYFQRMAALTMNYYNNRNDQAATSAFVEKLRKTGIEAEEAMLVATGGVNTHRGAIYSLGLLVSAATYNTCCGFFGAYGGGLSNGKTGENIFLKRCVETAASFALAIGNGSLPTSNGSKVRKKYGVMGPIEQAQQGFPLAMLAKNAKSEYYNRHRQVHGDAACEELAWAYALISVMAELDDNNALKRGGEKGAAFVKKRAAELKTLALSAEQQAFLEKLMEFDRQLIALNISCGGAADMLALALFLDGIEMRYANVYEMLSASQR